MADDFYSLKGFVSFGALTNNETGVISPIGELSLRSGTFAKDRALFTGVTATSPATTVDLTVFSGRSPLGAVVETPTVVSSLLLSIGAWVYKEAVDGTFQSGTESLRVPFLAQFGDKITSISIGAMVSVEIESVEYWFPRSLTLTLDSAEVWAPSAVPAGFESVRTKLWFSDNDFKQQYDEYDIAFIAPVPIADIDDLFQFPPQVIELLEAMTPPVMAQQVALAAGNSPYTVLSSFNFKYHHLGAPTTTTDAYWTFVIWSDFGNNFDKMKLDLAEWILDNSTHTREEWIAIFPDIFASTEFIITPLWNQYAIPNLSLDHAMYSPTIPFTEAVEFAHSTTVGLGYTEEYIDEHLTFLSMPYKSVACLSVGGPDNRDDKHYLYDFLPDFIDVPTSSIDFDRMSQPTRQWAMLIYSMLNVAEYMGDFTDIPSGMYRVKRTNANNDEVLYIGASINDVQYLVTSKQSLVALHPPVDRTSDPLAMLPDPTVTLTLPEGSLHLELNVSGAGGTAPYTFTATSEDIESGGSINPTTGFLEVDFLDYGTNQITVTMTDHRGFPLSGTYTVICTPDDDLT